MAGMTKTARGRLVDMNKLAQQNKNSIAITGGGHAMNANGDLLGPGGKILKTREEFELAYNENLENATKKVSIKSANIAPDPVAKPQEKTETPIKKTSPKIEEAVPVEELHLLSDEEVEVENIEVEEDTSSEEKKTKKRRKTTLDKE